MDGWLRRRSGEGANAGVGGAEGGGARGVGRHHALPAGADGGAASARAGDVVAADERGRGSGALAGAVAVPGDVGERPPLLGGGGGAGGGAAGAGVGAAPAGAGAGVAGGAGSEEPWLPGAAQPGVGHLRGGRPRARAGGAGGGGAGGVALRAGGAVPGAGRGGGAALRVRPTGTAPGRSRR